MVGRSITASVRVETRQLANTGLQFGGQYTLGLRPRQPEQTFSDDASNNFNLGYMDAFDPMLDWGYAQFDARHRIALSGISAAAVLQRWFRGEAGVVRRLADGVPLQRADRLSFSVFDCTNGLLLCMRVEDPVGIDRNARAGRAPEPERVQAARPHPAVPFAGGM